MLEDGLHLNVKGSDRLFHMLKEKVAKLDSIKLFEKTETNYGIPFNVYAESQAIE